MNPYPPSPRPWWKTTPVGLGLLAAVALIGAFSFPLSFLALIAAVALLWFLPPWRWFARLGASVGAFVLLAIGAGVGGQLDDPARTDAKPASVRTHAPSTEPSRKPKNEPTPPPSYRGKPLDQAETAARDAGYTTDHHDASVDHRAIVVRSGWQVCFRTSLGGPRAITFAAVKSGEPCPDKDGAKIPWPVMPDLSGRTWRAAVGELRDFEVSESAIRVESHYMNDALPEGDHDSWRVCDQNPAKGDDITAEVTLGLASPEVGCATEGSYLGDKDDDGVPDYRDHADDRVRSTPTGGSGTGGEGGTSGGSTIGVGSSSTSGGASSASGGGSSSTGGGGGGPVVHPGSFCSPAGARGVTQAGTAMVCGPASDGRNRWHSG
ncbi:PASTA domain-containing protein [Streptomyces sp. LaPpAH-108]|uniref:PASTA domain-containing protein n=1 Tax=Streptomyces sp. LaPpAH-108 TaxID=1155714 RepID=UPI0003A15AED|nr:PASTA domain-containing protein [Streptomyces sp. LaPpAH-108]